ncbi:hypothetical protein OSB04_026809 [Centaurea solstitialis]|uniref:F-box domain-containing protein n=1 Tax=Centaurea solstitialis TaxID=347529 RepID=A0AA38SK19_9ASTR|nr:hypothetical protein OSB04_026809 [Centaurea solstitialis]
MAAKRKTRSDQQCQKQRKRPRRTEECRLDSLPESLQLHILSFLDAKQAVQTSVLAKSWISLWTRTPVLRFNYIAFRKLRAFDKFVYNVLRFRDHAVKVNTLTFIRGGTSSAKVLKNVLDYAFSHGVSHLEFFIQRSRSGLWPVCPRTSSDSLKTLSLKSGNYVIRCPSLSGMFKNLAVLHLKGAVLKNLEPFSGFPMLEKLVLDDCRHATTTMTVEATRLAYLSITSHVCRINRCHLNTPNLRLFEYVGSDLPKLITHDGLPTYVYIEERCCARGCLNGFTGIGGGGSTGVVSCDGEGVIGKHMGNQRRK